jgi:hypothetical protein
LRNGATLQYRIPVDDTLWQFLVMAEATPPNMRGPRVDAKQGRLIKRLFDAGAREQLTDNKITQLLVLGVAELVRPGVPRD